MALTSRERQRRYMERKKEKAKLAGDPTDSLKRSSFAQFADAHPAWATLAENMASVGLHPAFKDDTDPEWDAEWEKAGETNRGSIGRAERMVGALMDSATELATIINDYKRRAIDEAIAKIERSNLTSPEARKKALAEVVRLTKLREQLDKKVRWEFPQCRVKHP